MGKTRIDPFKRPEGSDDSDDYWETPNGKENLPRKGARCLFELKGGVLINGHGIMDGFRAYGYMDVEGVICIPGHHAKLSPVCIKRWQYAPGPDFWNGSNWKEEE